MSLKEYIGKTRTSLNGWAENKLPGGNIWSEPMTLENYRDSWKRDRSCGIIVNLGLTMLAVSFFEMAPVQLPIPEHGTTASYMIGFVVLGAQVLANGVLATEKNETSEIHRYHVGD